MRFSRLFKACSTPGLRSLPRPLAGIVLALLALIVSGAHAEQVRSLQSVDFVALDGDRVLLTLTLSDAAPEPIVFAIDKPARLSVDLPGTHLALPERYRKVNVGKVRSVAAAEAQGRTRVVVELSDPTPYTTRVDGNKVYVELAGAAGALTGAIPQNAPAAAPAAAPAPAVAPAIADIDFRRGEKGEGRVLVTLNDPHIPVDVHEEGGKVIARFKNAALPDRLAKRLDVLDFATPAKFVDAIHDGPNTDIVVTPIGGSDFEQTGYQTGNQFVLELQPLTQEKLDQRKRDQPQYTGERISLSFQSVDIRSLLQIIADVAGTNMVVSDSVNGQIAMRLQNVPWDQALDIILRTKGLGLRQQGNVMLVAPLEELAQREKVELEAEKQKIQLAPLRSELIQVNYAKASSLAALLKSKENSLLSDRGSVTVDDRTNTLLVLESRDKLAEIRTLVQHLDIPVRQVLIESRIVVASDDYNRQVGVQFGVTGAGAANNGNLFTTSGSNTSTNTSATGYLANNRSGSVPIDTTQSDRYNINLPVTGAAGSIGLAILTKNFLVDLELQALQSEGRGQVVSSPHVITANAKQASIEQGVEIPYQQNAGGTVGGTSIAFKKAVLSLSVTPQITPDDRVIMDLAVTNDTVGDNVNTGGGGVAPAIDTRKVNTQVLVDNGQTVVLGGIYEQTLSDVTTKVPLLGDIPFLGVLFRNTNHTNNKSELLVFVTPKILNDSLNLGQ